MSDKKLPEIVADEEDLARVLFSPSFFVEGRIAPTAFLCNILKSGSVEDYVSVTRYQDGLDVDALSEKYKPRVEGDERYGYTLLNTGKARAIKIKADKECRVDVKGHPSKGNPLHAGIHIYLDGVNIDANTPDCNEIMAVRKHLTMICSKPIQFSGKESKEED